MTSIAFWLAKLLRVADLRSAQKKKKGAPCRAPCVRENQNYGMKLIASYAALLVLLFK